MRVPVIALLAATLIAIATACERDCSAARSVAAIAEISVTAVVALLTDVDYAVSASWKGAIIVTSVIVVLISVVALLGAGRNPVPTSGRRAI